jgi:4-amino-4-deoxy-L-arabinose transferase-like glycosyltransferase
VNATSHTTRAPRPRAGSRLSSTASSLPRRLARGSELDAVWARPALLALLASTALLYLWGLGASGYANDFYAAAAQAGSMSVKAMFFGALDPAGSITVDKPPAAIWLMAASVRLFGLSSWSILVPQALCGVASVAVLHAAVRRVSGPAAGLAAGALLALTPVAALMFRFDNPDALLTLLLVCGAYALTRALERASTGWIAAAGAFVGAAFLAKMLQAFLVLPAFALVYVVAAPTPLRRRLVQLIVAAAAVVVSAGWWVAIVELWPAGSRPYIGGSTSNSVLDLVFGYNGLSRISSSGGPGGGPGGGGGFSGAAGLGRLFNSIMGGEISWLLPTALIALAGGLYALRRAPRTDGARAALVLWGGSLLVTGAVFSFMTGIIHAYYTVALAPAIAALVAIGGRELLRTRDDPGARLLLSLGIAAGAFWSYRLLGRAPSWHPELRVAIVGAGIAAALLVLDPRLGRRGLAVDAVTAVAAAVALLTGTGAWTLATAATPHAGATPASGPAGVAAASRGGLPGGGGAPPSGFGGGARGATPPSGGFGAPPAGGSSTARVQGGETANASLVALLEADARKHAWAAATTGSMSAAPLQLASGQSVMAIGGFNGGDPAPTLAQFEKLVAAGKVHWYIAGGGGGGSAPGGGGNAIATWVAAHFTAKTVGGTTVYDLTQAAR